jgi:hypothetical protein
MIWIGEAFELVSGFEAQQEGAARITGRGNPAPKRISADRFAFNGMPICQSTPSVKTGQGSCRAGLDD